MATTQKISSNLWFDNQAEDAADFYTSIFKKSKKLRTTYYGKAGQDIHKMPEGSVMTVEFEIEGQKYVALNGGPLFTFNESISFIVNCESQEEIDYYWDRLSAGGDKNSQQCGWLKDIFGLSWQIVPTILPDMLADKNREKAESVMNVMMKMKKLNIRELEEAYRGKVKSYA